MAGRRIGPEPLKFGQTADSTLLSGSSGKVVVRSSKQLLLLGLLAFCLLASACVPGEDSSAELSEEPSESEELEETEAAGVPQTTIVPTMRPTSAEDLGIAIDSSGRPYDNYWGPQGATTETRLVSRFEVPGGRIELIQGEALRGVGLLNVNNTTTINFRTTGTYDLRVVWEQRPAATSATDETDDGSENDDSESEEVESDQAIVESVLGVMVAPVDIEVARWGEFVTAYETDEGLGGITTRSVIDWVETNLEPGEPLVTEEFPDGEPYLVDDIDGEPGRDVFLFDHLPSVEVQSERTDNRYVYTRGFDEDDRLVALMIWDQRFPWRLAVPEGEPPPDISEREDELVDCIEGRRLIDKWGRCT